MIKISMTASAFLIVLLLGVTACGTHKEQTKMDITISPIVMNQEHKTPMMGGGTIPSPTVYVYKMKKDYSHLVPVLMDDARTRILSYPHPKDLLAGKQLRLPTALNQNYWLDNRGIGPNVAFLSYTYEEYSALSAPPPMADLIAHILDKYPLLEIHACGHWADYDDIITELNKKITQGTLRSINGI